MINQETEDSFFRELKDLIIKHKIRPYALLTLLSNFIASILDASPDPYNKMLFFINRFSMIAKSLLPEEDAQSPLDDDLPFLSWSAFSEKKEEEDES